MGDARRRGAFSCELSWGIKRLRGGFLLATLAKTKNDVHDSKCAVCAVTERVALFGKPPKSYAYDRGGWSRENVEQLKKLGVRDVGLAPQGKAAWALATDLPEFPAGTRALFLTSGTVSDIATRDAGDAGIVVLRC